MTVAEAIEILKRIDNQDSSLVVLKVKRKANRLDDPEYEALDILAFEKGCRTSAFLGTFKPESDATSHLEKVIAIRHR
jgi:hypothetical protein